MFRRIISYLLVVLLLITTTLGVTLAASDVPDAVLSARDSVLRIETETADAIYTGSGFVVSNGKEGTFIATNYHVIENANSVRVWLDAGDLRGAEIVAADKNRDLAILKLRSASKSLKPLQLSENGKQGMAVYALGFPGAADYLTDSYAVSSDEITITDGLISALRTLKLYQNGPQVDFLQISVSINSGNSGGPLLDAQGRVVGINTLTIKESDGISGSVAVSELVDLLEQQEISYTKAGNGILLLFAIAIAILLLASSAFLLLKRAHRTRPITKKSQTLESYLHTIGRALTPQEAVSLLMPVLLEVRDQNQSGRLLQKLSPETICLRGNIAQIDMDKLSSSLLTLRYAAPEQRNGELCSAATDVYALCVILETMTNPTEDEAFISILRKGLAQDSRDRYATVQELIYAVAPYNTGISLQRQKQSVELSDEAREQLRVKMEQRRIKKQRVFRKVCHIGIVILACLVLLVGYCVIESRIALKRMDDGDFAGTKKITDRMFYYSMLPLKEQNYLYVADDVEQKDFERGYRRMDQLGDFRLGMILTQEIRYLEAAHLLNQNEFEKTIELYTKLGSYKDSEEKLKETCIGYGRELFSAKDYLKAYEVIYPYADVYSDWDVLIHELYIEAVNLFEKYEDAEAEKRFSLISAYEKSSDYLELITLLKSTYYSSKDIDRLFDFCDFERVKPKLNSLVIKQRTKSIDFLEGAWVGYEASRDGEVDLSSQQKQSTVYKGLHRVGI